MKDSPINVYQLVILIDHTPYKNRSSKINITSIAYQNLFESTSIEVSHKPHPQEPSQIRCQWQDSLTNQTKKMEK
jgi:hypothetical protein